MTVGDNCGVLQHICEDITKSEGDDRLYRGFILNNGLKVLVVSDENTEKAAASMDVHICKVPFLNNKRP